MHIVSLCHMFPNRANPGLGIFVKERLRYVARQAQLTMVAPVPSFPLIERTAKYAGYSSIPHREDSEGMVIFHPRYFMIPKYLKSLDALFYERSLRGFMGKVLTRDGGEVIDAHWVYPDGIAALEWGRRFGKKVVVTVRGNEALHYYQMTPIRRLLVEKMRSFDHIISVSEDLKAKLVAEYHVDPEKVTVIHNGIDRKKFSPGDRDAARESCGLSPNGRYILTISRLSSEKGVSTLIDAMERLRTEGATLLLVGKGPLEAEIRSMVQAKGLSDRVIFLGSIPQKDLSTWYRAADLLCLPSLWEGCPNVVIEALACGVPVVSSEVGAVPHFVTSDCGRVVPPGDAEALAQGLDAVLQTQWDAARIASLPALRSWDEVAEEVLEVMGKVLSPKTGVRGPF